MNKAQRERREYIMEVCDDDVIVLSDLDEALVGISMSGGRCRPAYGYQEILNTFIQRDKMTQEDAWEFYWYNVEPLCGGEQGPVVVEVIL